MNQLMRCMQCVFLLAAMAIPAAAQSDTSSGIYQDASGSSSGMVSLPAQSPYAGSVPEAAPTPGVLSLTLQDAIQRGLQRNLGLLLSSDATIRARSERWKELSELLPNVSGGVSESVQQINLQALGLRSSPALPVPKVVGPFNYFAVNGYWTQTVFNLKAIGKERAATQGLRAAQYSYKDARDLVVLAAGNAYLRTLSSAARVDTAQAQVTTADTLYQKTADQQKAGVSPAIDTLRARVELQTRQQQLIVARNDLAKDKLGLARVIGLATGQQFELADSVPYAPLAGLGLEESLKQAYASRGDYLAAQSQVRAAELSHKAATAAYLPSLSISSQVGDLGITPSNSHGTFAVTGTLSFPIFQGKLHADSLEADAALRQSQQQLDDLRGRIDYEVRTAFLDLAASADQVEVARSSVDLAEQTLVQARDRFAAGVTDNLEVVQAQESLANAHEQYISSLYAHNLAKVAIARALGFAEEGVKQYLKGK